MDEKEYTKQANATFSTQGHKKLWNYYLELVKTDYFQNKMSDLRKKYDIPTGGFKCKDIYTTPPDEWIHKGELKIRKEVRTEIRTMCKKYHLHTSDWSEVIEEYLFYNKLRPIYYIDSYNLCHLSDLVEEKREPFGKEFTSSDDQFYPIAIRISPYATERDIIDYVKKMFPLIKDFQKPYIKSEVRIGKVKKKKPAIQKRNNFIYENRELSINETKRLVEEKFGESLDYEYIGKIRSDEMRKRKEL